MFTPHTYKVSKNKQSKTKMIIKKKQIPKMNPKSSGAYCTYNIKILNKTLTYKLFQRRGKLKSIFDLKMALKL